MAKRQTRRSVSLTRDLYLIAQKYADSQNLALAHLISDLLERELAQAGIDTPSLVHYRPRPEPEAIRPALGGSIKLTTGRMVDPKPKQDPKLKQALDAARDQVNGVIVPLQPWKPDHRQCWWCGGNFGRGVMPTYIDGRALHDRCVSEHDRVARRRA